MARKKLRGTIESTKNPKTVVVSVKRLKKHPKYKKYITRTKRLKAHYETGEFKVGDRVVIEETRPVSKDKRWVVISEQ